MKVQSHGNRGIGRKFSRGIPIPISISQVRGSRDTAPGRWEGLDFVIITFCLKFLIAQFKDTVIQYSYHIIKLLSGKIQVVPPHGAWRAVTFCYWLTQLVHVAFLCGVPFWLVSAHTKVTWLHYSGVASPQKLCVTMNKIAAVFSLVFAYMEKNCA